MADKKKQTIAIDFDGVLADYSEGYQGKDVFGSMVPGADNATKVLKENGWIIIIYTTRPATEALKKWLDDNKITYDYINENPDQPEESKGCKLMADVYLDDRSLQFRGQWRWMMNDIACFKPWCNDKKEELKEMRSQYKSIFDIASSANCAAPKLSKKK